MTLLIDTLRLRGTAERPDPPRDVKAASGARKVLLTWNLPLRYQNITRWRIYRDTEQNLAMEVADRGTRQMPMDATAGASPPTVNFFVSSVTAQGQESQKVQVQGQATAEAGAPSDPAVPPDYTTANPGGGNKSLGYSAWTRSSQ